MVERTRLVFDEVVGLETLSFLLEGSSLLKIPLSLDCSNTWVYSSSCFFGMHYVVIFFPFWMEQMLDPDDYAILVRNAGFDS